MDKSSLKNKLQIFAASFVAGVVSVTLFLPLAAHGDSTEELNAQLQQIQAQITEYQKEIGKVQSQKNTLTNKIAALKKEQSQVQLQIKATNLQLDDLDGQLSNTQTGIDASVQKINQLYNDIGTTLEQISQEDHKSLLITILEQTQLSAIFGEFESLEQLSQALVLKTGEVQAAKAVLDQQYSALQTEQDAKKDFLSVQVLQQQDLVDKTTEQSTVLKQTKGQEAQYQSLLSDSKKQAQAIKSRIYDLLGVSTQITFGDAVTIAKWASSQSGVRPALILAILTQESNLGKNVGTCNRPGDPPEKSWKVVMKPDRDQVPFQAITAGLGIDPNVTPVSCPMKDKNGKQIGWGGAMGPSQFIPSTWTRYQSKVTAVTGKASANPWDMRDAFLATALLLRDNGAAAGTEAVEWKAAMLYFSGSTNPQFSFYGDSVIAQANKYEADIKALN